jgi:hypothetical protein
MLKRLMAMRVIGIYFSEEAWRICYYLASQDTWYLYSVFMPAHGLQTMVEAQEHAYKLSLRTHTPYLKTLTYDRAITIEDAIELLGPLELLADTQ